MLEQHAGRCGLGDDARNVPYEDDHYAVSPGKGIEKRWRKGEGGKEKER